MERWRTPFPSASFRGGLERKCKRAPRLTGRWLGHALSRDILERAGMKQQAIMQWIDVMNYAEARDCEHALRRAYATSGYDAALRAWAKCIDTTEQRKWWPRDVLAYVYALVGDKDRAVMTIGKAIREKDDCVLDLKVSPLWDSLRTDARFLRLVSRAGFDDVVNSTSYPSSLLDTYH